MDLIWLLAVMWKQAWLQSYIDNTVKQIYSAPPDRDEAHEQDQYNFIVATSGVRCALIYLHMQAVGHQSLVFCSAAGLPVLHSSFQLMQSTKCGQIPYRYSELTLLLYADVEGCA